MSVRLQIRPPSGAAYEFNHAGPVIRIGRNPDCDLTFNGAASDNVSWDHAELAITDKAASLTDVGSTNGTYLNGAADRLKSCVIKAGDEFRLGVTGPRIRVLELSMAGPRAAEAPTPRVAKAAAAPPYNGESLAGGRPMSFTRKMLIDTQSRNRRMTAVLAGLFLLLILLICGIVFLVNSKAENVRADVDVHREKVERMGKAVDNVVDQVGDLKEQVAGVVKGVQEVQDLAKKHDTELQELKPRLVEIKQDALRRHQEIKDELTKNAKAAGPEREINNLNQAFGRNNDASDGEPPLKLEPGMRLSLRLRGSSAMSDSNYDNCALAYATKDHLELAGMFKERTLSVPFNKIETIFVENQMYRYNPRTEHFEPGLDFYKLDISGSFQKMRRSEITGDLSFFERGTIQGEGVTRCFVQSTDQGLVLVLPRGFRSLGFPGSSISRILTNKGEYQYVEDKKEYHFETWQAICRAAEAKQREEWKQEKKDEWDRRKEAYKLITERVRASRPFWWYWW